MASSDNVPGYGGDLISGERDKSRVSGTASSGDATNEPGQYPVGGWGNAIFGGQLPDGTGAPGTQGAQYSSATDPTNEPGQVSDGLTGITDAEITNTGAPGTQGAQDSDTGADSITFTRPGSPYSGTYAMDTVTDNISGTGDWTAANDQGYGSDFAGQIPGLKGNEPQAGEGRYQPGGAGKVMRGGRAVKG